MKWTSESNPWRRRFALLPVTLHHGPTRETIWLQWFWARDGGDCREVSFTDPATAIRSNSHD